MKPPRPAASAPNSPRSSRSTASTTWKPPSNASPAGIPPTRMRRSGRISRGPTASVPPSNVRWKNKMGIHVIKMPDIGEGIAEVELVAWNVQVGDTVVEDMNLADVMTDKATVEIPSPVHGKVLALGGQVGQVMAVGSELIRIEVEGAGNVRDGTTAAVASPTTAPKPAPVLVFTVATAP